MLCKERQTFCEEAEESKKSFVEKLVNENVEERKEATDTFESNLMKFIKPLKHELIVLQKLLEFEMYLNPGY